MKWWPFGGNSEKNIQREPLKLEVDIHSHLLPGLDDGVSSYEESIEMLTIFQELGYRKVITTPHVMGDSYKNTPEIILEAVKGLQEKVIEAGLTIQVQAAAEYYADEYFEKYLDEGNLLTFGDNHFLVETAFMSRADNFFNLMFKAQSAGYKPVLAHVERYMYLHGKPNDYQDLWDRGLLFQVNLGSLVGHYGPEVRDAAQMLLSTGKVHLLGSDAHKPKHMGMLRAGLASPLLSHIEIGQLLNPTL